MKAFFQRAYHRAAEHAHEVAIVIAAEHFSAAAALILIGVFLIVVGIEAFLIAAQEVAAA